MARAIFYTLQTSGACAGVYECDRTHQMEKTTAADHITLKFLKAVFNKFHLIHSWILCPTECFTFLMFYLP